MAYDDQFLRAMRIKVEDDIIAAPPCQRRQVQIRVLPSDEPGHVMLSEEDCWKLLDANRGLEQKVSDLQKCVQNWLEQSRENNRGLRAWRTVALILAGGMMLIEGIRLWIAQ